MGMFFIVQCWRSVNFLTNMPADEAELLKAGTQGIVEGALKPFNNLIQALLGPAVTEVGLFLRDSVHDWREKRQVRLFQRTQELLAAAHINPHPVPFKILISIVENCSNEDDDSLQDRWANLLANAADPTETCSVAPSFPEILKELTARDVQLLDALFVEAVGRHEKGSGTTALGDVAFSFDDIHKAFSDAGLSRYKVGQWLSAREAQHDDVRTDISDIHFILDTLERNSLFVKKPEKFQVVIDAPIELDFHYSFSELGLRFVRACREPKSKG
jgi:hypothetical protein